MSPATVALRVWRNARYVEEFPFTAPSGGDEDAPFDLTGWSAKFQVRLYGAAAGDPILSLTNQTTDVQGVWIIEPSQGIIRIRIDEASIASAWSAIGGGTEAGDAAELKYDLVLTPPAGGDEVWMQGDFIIEPGVTV